MDKFEPMVQNIGTIGLAALRSFNSVARLGGMSAAAQRLGMAKSGVSRHVAQLEAHFGAPLMQRSGRTVKLTPLGERLHGRIASILAEIDQLADIAREESSGVSGQVSIAATPEFGGLVASTLFPIINARHRDLKLVMRTAYAFEDMQDPSTDIAFRIGTFKDDRLVARRLGEFRAWLVASPAFVESHRVSAPEDLATTPCLIFRGERAAATWTLHGKDNEIPISVEGFAAVQSFTILRDLALAGHGVAFIPEVVAADAVRAGDLVRILPDFASRAFPVFLTFRPGARRIARLDAVISLAEEHVPRLLAD
ncbi:MAG: LysR family transcriptional regulator [Pseudomonadota bacterium]